MYLSSLFILEWVWLTHTLEVLSDDVYEMLIYNAEAIKD